MLMSSDTQPQRLNRSEGGVCWRTNGRWRIGEGFVFLFARRKE